MDLGVRKQDLALTKAKEKVPAPKQKAQHGKGKSMKFLEPIEVFTKNRKGKRKAFSPAKSRRMDVVPSPLGCIGRKIGFTVSPCLQENKDIIPSKMLILGEMLLS